MWQKVINNDVILDYWFLSTRTRDSQYSYSNAEVYEYFELTNFNRLMCIHFVSGGLVGICMENPLKLQIKNLCHKRLGQKLDMEAI